MPTSDSLPPQRLSPLLLPPSPLPLTLTPTSQALQALGGTLTLQDGGNSTKDSRHNTQHQPRPSSTTHGAAGQVSRSGKLLGGACDGLLAAPPSSAQRNGSGGADSSPIREVRHSGKPLDSPSDCASAAQPASAQGDDRGGVDGSGSSPEHKVGTLTEVMLSSESVCEAQSGCTRTAFKAFKVLGINILI